MVCYRVLVTTLAEDLRTRLSSRSEVAIAVLFGSGARGRLQRGSDVDLAVRWSSTPPSDLVSLLADLERATGRTIDLIDLDSAPPQLRFEIARSGLLLVERVPGTWSELRARAYLDWWDFAPLARRIHRAAVARLREAVDGLR